MYDKVSECVLVRARAVNARVRCGACMHVHAPMPVRATAVAADGDAFCRLLFYKAGRQLGRMARCLAPHLPSPVSIVAVGSVWKSWALLKDGFLEAACAPLPAPLCVVAAVAVAAAAAAAATSTAARCRYQRMGGSVQC